MNFPFAFLNPWILAGLVFLPVLWYLLRVTPPAPRRIVFPAARFLAGLKEENQTARLTPWWILLMRLLAAALIMIALARPVLHPSGNLSGTGPVRIVVDNGWAAARNWPQAMQVAADLADRAAREGRALYVMTTAPEPGSSKPILSGPLSKGQAESALRGLSPRPWPADYTAAMDLLTATQSVIGIHSFFLSHGLEDAGDAMGLLGGLEKQGALSIYHPDSAHWPLLLRKVADPGEDVLVYVDAPLGSANGSPVTIEAIGQQGKVLDAEQFKLDTANLPNKIKLDMPAPLRSQVSVIRLAGRPGAGGVLMFDDQAGRKSVGIVSAVKDNQATPLVDAMFYINRALGPFADLQTGTVPDLVKAKPAVIVMPDIGGLPAEELNALEDWVKNGGLLLRFAGPNMSKGDITLTPVPLRRGGRALNGAMTWEKPLHLAAFPDNSPYRGLAVPADVTVKQQLLAEPVDNMARKTWATLEDGTPLITADALGRGMLVMVHTTATPAWSDLALSGAFVEILHRTVNLAGLRAEPTNLGSGALQPLSMIDGFGMPAAPDTTVQPIPGELAATQKIDSHHPPGIYGRPGISHAMNIGAQAPILRSFSAMPSGAKEMSFGKERERELMPDFLMAALIIFCADWLVMIVLQAGWRLRIAGLSLLLLLMPAPAHAQNTDVKYAGAIYLAFVRSGDLSVDKTAQAGLENLVRTLNERTSVEPAGVVALDPAKDNLAFFPLIYWPVTANAVPLTAEAQRRVQDYLDHGGTILFDTSDRATVTTAGANSPALQRIAGALNIPPLIPMPQDHVLTRSFYLLRGTPGRYDGGTIWVEDQSASGRDGVSSVIVGGNDWAAAWASLDEQTERLSGGGDQNDHAMRFGINLVMYALTGNYKSDQVHLKQIMERLGQ